LALAAIASVLIGDLKDAVFIGAVLLLNAVIGGYQEWKADRSTGALQGMLKIRSTVLRDGNTHEVDAEELVPGDIILLESGNRVERTLIGGLVIGLASFAVFRHLMQTGVPIEEARNLVLLLMVFFEIVHIGNCRSESVSAFVLSPLRNPILLGGSLLALALHFAAMSTALGQSLLRAAPVSISDAVWLGGISLSVLVFMEIHKFFIRARIKRAGRERLKGRTVMEVGSTASRDT
jgi:magnesium-transporting ATPase (P-type)